MSIAGRRIGAYEVIGLLGAGGMGEVYRARDSRLGRDVAIKVLPAPWLADPDRRARLEREARLLASLDHAHIATIHSLEECDGVLALVLEYIDGPTLAERIALGPVPPGEALAIATQIADALDAAHERGIVHRDLKPANIKVTPGGEVKVLDFGLATMATASGESGVSAAPTLTGAGSILGTVGYMSPEQARGQPVDKRTDIWAFGCVLFELFAGRPAFARATASDTLVAVLEHEPDWSRLPATTPGGVRRLIELCLRKDTRRRLRDVGDARLMLDGELADLAPPPAAASARVRWLVLGVCAGALAAGAAAGWYVHAYAPSGSQAPARFLIDVRPADAVLGPHALERTPVGRQRPSRPAIALSPDGRTLVFSGVRDGQVRLYARALDGVEAVAIAGTEGADSPFFSPDGRWIGFWSADAIRKVPIAGGTAVKICDAKPLYGAQWAADDRILFAQLTGIWRVSPAGGRGEQLTKAAPGEGEARHLLPFSPPSTSAVIYTVQTSVNDWEGARIVVQPADGGPRKTLVENAADARYVSGHLIYMRLGTLMAAPFDTTRLTLTSGEFEVVRGVMQSVNSTVPYGLDTGAGQYTASTSGLLAYISGGPHLDPENELQWIGRDGHAEPIPVPPPSRAYFLPRLSPDGRFIAVGTLGLRDQNLWKYDIAQRTLTRLTVEGRTEQAVWSPDGTQIAFASMLKGAQNIYVTRSDGSAAAIALTTGGSPQFPGSWTPDAKELLLGSSDDIVALKVDGPHTLRPIVSSLFVERMPVLSRNGRWLAYVSNETGRAEVYVQAFPTSAAKFVVSTEGGTQPVWSRDGTKLYYLAAGTKDSLAVVRMIEVDVVTDGAFAARSRRQLFELDASHYGGAAQAHSYDVTPDGRRFVFVREVFPAGAAPRQIQMVGRWLDDQKRAVDPQSR